MPLPLGHISIGLAVYDLHAKNSSFSDWKAAVSVAVLANLPDVDVALGLLLQGNGNAFHRGPTHSFLFALLAGLLAANIWRICSCIPRMGFTTSFLIILSHVLSDVFLTRSPVSFSFPLQVTWAAGHSGWGEVLISIVLKAYQDIGIIAVCLVIIVLKRQLVYIRQRRVGFGSYQLYPHQKKRYLGFFLPLFLLLVLISGLMISNT